MKTNKIQTVLTQLSTAGILRFACAAVLVVCSGCRPPKIEQIPICPGKADIQESLAALQEKQARALSIKAAVDCVMRFPEENGRMKNETFYGSLRFIAPDKLYIGGDRFGQIRIGSNPSEFWMYVKPGLDTARYGKRELAESCSEKLGFNPFYLAEAIGQIDLTQPWTLSNMQGLDILTAAGEQGTKKVYINCCTYIIERIEYCDIFGRLVASADLSSHQTFNDIGTIPTRIELRHFSSAQNDMTLEMTLSDIERFVPTAGQMRLFERPEPKGYKYVLALNENCEFVIQ